MSRKSKSPKSLPPHSRDSAILATEAEAALNALHYKEATEFYKELVKRERRPAWVDGLALCYTGRAHDLAAKGMIKEALVLWRNRAELCGKPLIEGPYVDWLMQTGEQKEIFRLLAVKNPSDTVSTELEARFAAAVLVASDRDLVLLPSDHPLLRHRPLALAALAAYYEGNFAALEEQLQAIPFRSPYRDLKSILKALILLETQTEAAQAALARVPADGPFERLRVAVQVVTLPGSRWMEALSKLDEAGQQWVMDIKGCPDTLRPLLLELAKLGHAPAAVPLFDLLLRYRRALPEGVAAKLCRQLLPHAPARLKNYTSTFGKLREEEQTHILASTAERQGDRRSAVRHWMRLAQIQGAGIAPEQKRSAALIWRHIVGNENEGAPNELVIDCFKKIVELDPDDRDSQLKLIRTLRSEGDLQQARVYLDKALSLFPKDAGLLIEAVETALAGKAFKKAVGLAKQVLELDPINPQVRVVIGHAHFSHTRKQIKAHNFQAARKELKAAEEWLRAPTDRATLKLLNAFAAEDEVNDDNALLREAIADLGGSLVGGFHLLLEVGRVGFDPAPWLVRGGVDLAETFTPDAVVALARTLNATQDGEKALRAALDPVRAPLKRAAKAKFSEADHRLVCEAWQRIKQNDLLCTYAESALQRWPGRPVFVYFKIFARYGDKPYLIPMNDINALEQAAKEARNQNDPRTEQRIRKLLSPPVNKYQDEEEYDDLPDDPLMLFEAIIGAGGEDAFIDMVRKQVGERNFKELKEMLGSDKKQFLRALIELMLEMIPPARGRRPRRPTQPVPGEIQGDLFDG